LLNDVPGVDRLVGVFDREHIVEAVRGRRTRGRSTGIFWASITTSQRELAEANGVAVGLQKETKTNRLPVFEDDRADLRLTPRHYAFLRMSEGCNQGCSFCTIPSIRGLMRSKPIEQILLEANELAADGAVELNLIGQDTTSYGTDIGYAAGLSGLLNTLDKKASPRRQLAAADVRVPVVLQRRDDPHDRGLVARREVHRHAAPAHQRRDSHEDEASRDAAGDRDAADKLREWVPGIAIRTTFIAGTPGETDQQHRSSSSSSRTSASK
jgi:ribosomal protein S12 methylthiotransferase